MKKVLHKSEIVAQNDHEKTKQDGRLAPAYFSPEYKIFDQHMQTFKNETTV